MTPAKPKSELTYSKQAAKLSNFTVIASGCLTIGWKNHDILKKVNFLLTAMQLLNTRGQKMMQHLYSIM